MVASSPDAPDPTVAAGEVSAPEELDRLAARLRAAGCVFAEEEARLLLDEAAPGPEREQLVLRRLAGEPLELVLGWGEFCGLRVSVAPGVFVPRRRTRLLAETASTHARQAAAHPVVVDLCCGTGAVGMVVVSSVDVVELHAVDVDPAAVRCARANLPGQHVHEGDLYAPLPDRLRGRVDVVVANAPYVPTADIALMPPEARDHEHRVALDGGVDGLDLHRRIAAGAADWLSPGGTLLIETSLAQAEGTAEACRSVGLLAETLHDDSVEGTVVRARGADRRADRRTAEA